jgi:hypothetical protein
MYKFLIEKDSVLAVESLQLIEEIRDYNRRYRHLSKIEYHEITIGDLCNFQQPGYIPVGSIHFVARYLALAHNIFHMTPIEIPDELMCERFLLRDYKVVPYSEIPKTGMHFIKDISTLKSFTYSGSMEAFFDQLPILPKINQSHIYQVSDILNILSEYRVIVIDNEIEAIQYYNGDPTVMPSEEEILKIKIMVLKYSLSKNKPGAYTMDVAVIKKDDKRDLALIEVHPAVAFGTYGYSCPKIIDMYAKGFDWYVQCNKTQKYMKDANDNAQSNT